jgi:hypothetical protein
LDETAPSAARSKAANPSCTGNSSVMTVVTEDHRCPDDGLAYSPAPPVVQVRATDPPVRDADHSLVGPRFADRDLLDSKIAGGMNDHGQRTVRNLHSPAPRRLLS